MSRIGGYRISVEETEDYRLGWESAERGDPFPQWKAGSPANTNLTAQRLGWADFITSEQSK